MVIGKCSFANRHHGPQVRVLKDRGRGAVLVPNLTVVYTYAVSNAREDEGDATEW